MAKLRTVHRCTECGASHPKWAGRCPSCSAWNSLVEEVEETRAASTLASIAGAAPAVPITEVDATDGTPVATGIGELDRVLGGGLVPGSVTVLGGEPGIGKSTLLLDVAARRASLGASVLYVTGEESPAQVRGRAERLGALRPNLYLQAETVLPGVLATIESLRPELVVVDSIQTMSDPDIGSAPGSVVQVRECAHRLVREAKERGTTVVLVGHVTKEGGLAGPRLLEHVVDTVLSFEGERHHALRLLRAVKHRFGATTELGLFEMLEDGLAAVADPSGLFLADRRKGVPGSAVVPLVEGQRPLLVEVQALVAKSDLPNPRRSAQGLDHARLGMLLAVLAQRVGFNAGGGDVYVSTVGGVRLGEHGADLAVCLALVSAITRRPVPDDLVACGEVGLGGELRQASQIQRRLAEAARLGFTRAIVPMSAPNGVPGISVLRAAGLSDALGLADLLSTDRFD
jgi:DNA repair protein RadA/Sms